MNNEMKIIPLKSPQQMPIENMTVGPSPVSVEVWYIYTWTGSPVYQNMTSQCLKQVQYRYIHIDSLYMCYSNNIDKSILIKT